MTCRTVWRQKEKHLRYKYKKVKNSEQTLDRYNHISTHLSHELEIFPEIRSKKLVEKESLWERNTDVFISVWLFFLETKLRKQEGRVSQLLTCGQSDFCPDVLLPQPMSQAVKPSSAQTSLETRAFFKLPKLTSKAPHHIGPRKGTHGENQHFLYILFLFFFSFVFCSLYL